MTNSNNWRETLVVYRDARMAKILLLGFISGFPWLLISSMVVLWLKEEGISRSGIGLFGLVFSVYAFNVLWAPVVDSVRIPFLSQMLGRRRAWIVLMQSVIAIAMLGIAFYVDAAEEGGLWLLSLLIFIIALASATQDVAIDALRIEQVRHEEPQKLGAGAAMTTSGWWLGFGGGKVLALPFVQWLQESGIVNAWQAGYAGLIVVVVLSMLLLVWFVREAPISAAPTFNWEGMPTLAVNAYVQPIKSFVVKYSLQLGLLLLTFIFFFKIGEAFLGRMSLLFYKEIGFTKSEIGLVSGGLGAITVSAFSILGGFINARYGLFRGILLGGIAMASTNLLFAVLAFFPERWLFITAVVTDQFTTAISTVAFVAFLSQLCDRAHTATHYAALASLGNLSRTTMAAASGFLVDGLGGNWTLFFIITMLMVLPSLFILVSQRRILQPLMQGATTKLL